MIANTLTAELKADGLDLIQTLETSISRRRSIAVKDGGDQVVLSIDGTRSLFKHLLIDLPPEAAEHLGHQLLAAAMRARFHKLKSELAKLFGHDLAADADG